MLTASIQPTEMLIFSHKNADLYWEALIQVAKGNKEEALKIVALMREDKPISITPSWKEKQPQNIDDFFDKLFLSTVSHDPQMLSYLGLLETIGIHEHNAQLNDLSPETFLQVLEEKKENLYCLNNYLVENLTDDQKISHKVFSWMLHHAVAGKDYAFHPYFIHQLDGILVDVNALFTQFHKIENHQDVQNYILRLQKIPLHFKQAIDLLELQKEKGIQLPQFTVEKVISIIRKSTPELVEENIFYKNLAQQIAKINVPNQDTLLEQAKRVIEQEVYPAYRLLQNYFMSLLNAAQTSCGVWTLPCGDEYYSYMLQRHTTTNLTADEIHALGLQEVAKIHNEMRQILIAENCYDHTKSIGLLVQELAQDPRFYYPNTDEGRAECLAHYQTILERSRKELGHLFNIKPQAGVQIQRVPAHEEDGAPAAYYCGPSADRSRPGTFFANLRDMNEIPKYGMETLTIHEAEPGHHFQIALQYEQAIPMLRKLSSYTAYIEGWALYTEKLAYEQGFYSSSFDKLGHLQDELLRAVRLVVDTGIHHQRWTREQAIDYMEEITGYAHNTIVTEVERYFVLPGQACAYKIGQLKILELRKRAQEKLGQKFDIRDFHDVILKVAAVPLIILEEIVDQYIKEKLIA